MSTGIDKAELKEAIREVLREELLTLAVNLTPLVPDAEMREIEKAFTAEDFKDGEFVDGSAWLGR